MLQSREPENASHQCKRKPRPETPQSEKTREKHDSAAAGTSAAKATEKAKGDQVACERIRQGQPSFFKARHTAVPTHPAARRPAAQRAMRWHGRFLSHPPPSSSALRGEPDVLHSALCRVGAALVHGRATTCARACVPDRTRGAEDCGRGDRSRAAYHGLCAACTDRDLFVCEDGALQLSLLLACRIFSAASPSSADSRRDDDR